MIFSQFVKFIGVGGANTIVTYSLYLLLLLITNYVISYTIAYIFGIGLSYWLNLKFVFQEKSSKKKMTLFPLMYFVQYLLGIIVLYTVIHKFNIPKEFAPIMVVVITIPITFFMSKLILVTKEK